MKKFFSVFSFVMAIASVSFVSCSNDDDVIKTIDPQQKPQSAINMPTYAKLEVKAVEDLFELGDFIITLEHDGITETYKLDESTKVDKVTFEGKETIFDREVLPGRVLVIPPFKFNSLPVKYSAQFVYNEAAKERMKNAPMEDQIDFGVYAILQSCREDGKVTIPFNPLESTRLFSGVYVNDFDSFLDQVKKDSSNIFSQKL